MWAKALIVAGHLAIIQSDYERAEPLCKESLALYRELEDQPGIAFSLSLLGSVSWTKGNMATARTLTEEALAISRQIDDAERSAYSLFILGLLSSSQGEYARACALYEESLAIHRDIGNKIGIAHSLSQLAQVLLVSQSDQARVSPLLEECLALSREVGFKEGDCGVLLHFWAARPRARRPGYGTLTSREECSALQGDGTPAWHCQLACPFREGVRERGRLCSSASALRAEPGDLV